MITMNELVDLRMQQHIANEIYRQQIMQRIPDPFPAMLPVPMPRHIMLPPRVALPGVNAELQNNDLWKQFHHIGTEMIITKSGRRMFPSMRLQLSGLEDDVNYCVLLEMIPIGDCRYKFSGSQWVPAGGAEPQSPQRMYLHPDSPASGSHWQAQPILFNKVKLTNNTLDSNGHIVLTSMHKYQPRIHIIRTSDPSQIPWAAQQPFIFPETEFVAVTAYQNDRITKLKIDNNPFAKGFRETGQSRCKRKITNSLNQDEQHETNVSSPIKDGEQENQIAKRLRSNSSTCSVSSLEDERQFSFNGSTSSGASSPIIDQQHIIQSRNNELLMQHLHQNMQTLINPSFVDLACSYFGRSNPPCPGQFYSTSSYYSSPIIAQQLNQSIADHINGSPLPADIAPPILLTQSSPNTASATPSPIKGNEIEIKQAATKKINSFSISAILGVDH